MALAFLLLGFDPESIESRRFERNRDRTLSDVLTAGAPDPRRPLPRLVHTPAAHKEERLVSTCTAAAAAALIDLNLMGEAHRRRLWGKSKQGWLS